MLTFLKVGNAEHLRASSARRMSTLRLLVFSQRRVRVETAGNLLLICLAYLAASFSGNTLMSRLGFNIAQQVGSAAPQSKPTLRVVSREPFSPIASFLLGLTAGLGAATGLFLVVLR